LAEPLTLASASPQRRAILEQLGIVFRVVVPDVEELSVGEPRELARENALRKARAVDGERVLGVDTEVALDGRVFGKPAGAEQAEDFLRRLSGRAHTVVSGMVLRAGDEERATVCETEVRFRRLSGREIDWYVSSGEWRDRAGGYAIQGRGAALVEAIAGDYWNVVGLPVSALIGLAPELIRS
jgi:septum formation protein